MKTENGRGPWIDPCGSEALLGKVPDDWPDQTALMDRSVK